jgi:TetR/AcrR family transcriptional repressor of nem operon
MRTSKEKTAENRAALVRAASKLIRERGIDGVGVAEISKAAGLTHGALYAHFRSKEELALAALAHGLEQTCAGLNEAGSEGAAGLARFLDDYLSPAVRDDYAANCPVAASASEIGRQDAALGARFAEGIRSMASAFERGMAPAADARARALTVVAAMAGAQALARGAAKGDPALSAEMLDAARATILTALLAPRAG